MRQQASRHRLWIAIAAIAGTTACQNQTMEEAAETTVDADEILDSMEINMADSLLLSDSELRDQIEKAEGGDGEAASRVSQHYSAYPETYEEMIHWLEIAANLGRNDAAQSLVTELSVGLNQDCDRAEYWMDWLDMRVRDRQEREENLVESTRIGFEERCQQ